MSGNGAHHSDSKSVLARRRIGDRGGGKGDGTHMSNLESRVNELEYQVGSIQTTLARMETKMDGFATKEDMGNMRAEMHSALRAQAWSTIGALGVMTAIFALIVKWPF